MSGQFNATVTITVFFKSIEQEFKLQAKTAGVITESTEAKSICG